MLRMPTELRPSNLPCLVFILAVSAPLLSCASHLEPMACIQIEASMGPFYRWPTANPGMVAPVNVVWNYPTYRNPLRSSFAGKSIQIDIPDSFGQFAGFHLGTTAVPTSSDPRFRLARIDIRKPAQAYAGLGQALTHVMEAVLIHYQENGDKWANVIIPFQVSTNGNDMDIIAPIINGVKLPSRTGQTAIVMASAVSELMLSPAFDDATFSEFWGDSPVYGCTEKQVSVRYFMRTTTLAIGIDTFEQLSAALENVPVQDPTQPPPATWTLHTCKNGTTNTGACAAKKGEDMEAQVKKLEQYQSQALAEQRARKADLDTKLADLKKHTGEATPQSIALYNAADAAYQDLQASAAELLSAESNVDKAKVFASEAAMYHWDEFKPKGAGGVANVTTTTTTFQQASLMGIGQEAVSTAASLPEALYQRMQLLRPSFLGKRRVSV